MGRDTGAMDLEGWGHISLVEIDSFKFIAMELNFETDEYAGGSWS